MRKKRVREGGGHPGFYLFRISTGARSSPSSQCSSWHTPQVQCAPRWSEWRGLEAKRILSRLRARRSLQGALQNVGNWCKRTNEFYTGLRSAIRRAGNPPSRKSFCERLTFVAELYSARLPVGARAVPPLRLQPPRARLAFFPPCRTSRRAVARQPILRVAATFWPDAAQPSRQGETHLGATFDTWQGRIRTTSRARTREPLSATHCERL